MELCIDRLVTCLILDCKRLSTPFSPIIEYLSSTYSGFSGPKTMFSGPFHLAWLISSFHYRDNSVNGGA